METAVNSMCNLYDLGNDQYRVQTSSFGSRQGSLRDVVQFMVFGLYIEYKEIEMALVNMNSEGNDAAEFGMFGTFIFSFNSQGVSRVG